MERTFGFKFQRLLVVDLRVWTSKWNLWQLWTFHCEVFKSLCVFPPKNPKLDWFQVSIFFVNDSFETPANKKGSKNPSNATLSAQPSIPFRSQSELDKQVRQVWRENHPQNDDLIFWKEKYATIFEISYGYIDIYIYTYIYIHTHIYIWSSPPWFPPTPPQKGGYVTHMQPCIGITICLYWSMYVCLCVCLLVCKYVRVPARSTCHCFCVCTQRYYMYT